MALIKGLSVGFVIVCPSGVLVGHTTGSDHWDVPKGRLDPGEEPLEGAKRELTEETGLSWVDVRRGSVVKGNQNARPNQKRPAAIAPPFDCDATEV